VIGIGTEMSGWAWLLMVLMAVSWLVVAVAAVYIALASTRNRDRRTRP
jgi:hypothetical protein